MEPVLAGARREIYLARPSHLEPAMIRRFFREYDVRGLVTRISPPEVVEQIGLGLGSDARRAGGKRVVLARDCRESSDALPRLDRPGLMATGCDVTDIGVVPTPLVYLRREHAAGRRGW